MSVLVGLADAALVIFVVLLFVWLKGADASCLKCLFGKLPRGARESLTRVGSKVVLKWDMWHGGEAAVQARIRARTVDAEDISMMENPSAHRRDGGGGGDGVGVGGGSGIPFSSGGSQPGTAEITDRELEMTVSRTKRPNDQSRGKSKTTTTTSKQRGRRAHERAVSSGNPAALDVATGELPQQPQLPEGWRRVMDATDSAGRYYYINSHTEETQWEVPTAPARPTALSRKVTYMPQGWSKLFTDEGAGYYVDPENKSQWEKPPGND